MNRTTNIVVGVDFSPCATGALRQALRLGAACGAKVHVVHVVASSVVKELASSLGSSADTVQGQVSANCHEELEKLLGEIKPAAKPSLTVAFGNPLDEIMRTVQATGSEVVVLGFFGTTGGHDGPGTLAARCVRAADSSVLLTQLGKEGPFRRIVACIDFSSRSPDVVRKAARLAMEDKAELHLLHVFYGPWNVLHYRAPTPSASPDFQAQFRAGLLGRISDMIEPMLPELQGLKYECVLREHDSGARGIVDYVKESNADLLVIGTHGHSLFNFAILGGTAERVLSKIPCSVFTVRTKDK